MLNRLLPKTLRLLSIALMLSGLTLALQPVPTAYAATITVNSAADVIANDGQCTLREAITAANTDTVSGSMAGECPAGSGADVITINPSLNDITIMLSIIGTGEDYNATGDLDIRSDITIQGNSARHTVINADRLDRVFHVTGTYSVVFNDITITNDSLNAVSVNDGGGILNEGGSLTLNRCAVVKNVSTGFAGGIKNNQGTLVINNSTISGNEAWNGDGGGIENYGGTLIINNSTISGNTANSTSEGLVGGGGISNANGPSVATTEIYHSTITGNVSEGGIGGGIHNDSGTIDLLYSIVSGNSARYFVEPDWLTEGTEINNWGGLDNITADFNVLGHDGWTNGEAYFDLTFGAADFDATSDENNIPLANIVNLSLNNNGGPTDTHALPNSSSPAVDRTLTSACTGEVDQRGAARNYGANVSTNCDSGAVELRNKLSTDCVGVELAYDTVNGVPYDFNFASGGGVVTIKLFNANGLTCITVEEMGPGADHLLATDGGPGLGSLRTGNWWHISGDVANGYDFDITLPYTLANENSRACRWPGNLGGYGWDCGVDGDTDFSTNVSVTRKYLDRFSDWAVGNDVGPTAIRVNHLTASSQSGSSRLWGVTVLALAGSSLFVWKYRKK